MGAPASGFNSSSPGPSGSKPSPMDLAATTAPSGPTGEYEEPPVPSMSSAPGSPVPPGPGGTLSNFNLQGNQLTVSLNINIGNKWWQNTYDYQATLTDGQIAALKSSGAGSLTAALQHIVPPPAYKCTNATNTLTHFPSNLGLFAKEFPYEYHKFILNIELQIFRQINSQQQQAMNQIKQTMQQMSQD